MKNLKRIRYNTMNSWNNSTSIAYNLKVYNVIDRNLQNKVYELMDCEEFYDGINLLIHDFNAKYGFEWQAAFNGRSGGYLVLYKGGGLNSEGRVTCYSGKNVELNEVPVQVRKDFRQLAVDIVKTVEYMAKNAEVVDDVKIIKKPIKTIQYK